MTTTTTQAVSSQTPKAKTGYDWSSSMKMNAAVRQDLHSVIASFHARANNATTPYYAFSIHVNGKEIAVGRWTHDLRSVTAEEYDYVYSRKTGVSTRPKSEAQWAAHDEKRRRRGW